jgi:hypothetical protein
MALGTSGLSLAADTDPGRAELFLTIAKPRAASVLVAEAAPEPRDTAAIHFRQVNIELAA